MSSLRDLEQHFFSDILHTSDTTIALIESSRRRAKNRLGIYQTAYRLRLLELFRKAYPALKNALGKRAFNTIAHRYIDAVPSQHFSARTIGCNLPTFLENTGQLTPWYRALATLEWQMEAVLMAKDDRCMTMADLQTVPPDLWGNLPLQLCSATALIECYDQLPEYWHLLMQNKRRKISPTEHKKHYLMWRNSSYHIQFVPLNTIDVLLLPQCKNAITFGDCCEQLMSSSETDAPAQAAQALSRWINWGVLKTRPSPPAQRHPLPKGEGKIQNKFPLPLGKEGKN